MANKLATFASGIQSGATGGVGLATISTNTRVRTVMGPLALVTDVPTFAGGTGKWFFGTTRVKVSGVAVISTTSMGQAVEFQQAGTMSVIVGDMRVAGM